VIVDLNLGENVHQNWITESRNNCKKMSFFYFSKFN
jgi:hypothetical protein